MVTIDHLQPRKAMFLQQAMFKITILKLQILYAV